MSFLKYLIPAAAALAGVVAQNDDGCSADPTLTIENAADATAIATCTTFDGSIAIATGAAEIALDGIETITGNLVAASATELVTLTANRLSEISGTFELQDSNRLVNLNFPQLKSVATIDWRGLANLRELVFTSQLTKANNVSILNTGLTSLDGINLEQVGGFFISGNDYIRQMSLQLGNSTGAITITDNGDALAIEFPNLIWAFSMDIANITSLDVASLEAINGSFALRGSTVEGFSAPNLTTVGSFTFTDNTQMTNLSAPLLETVGDDFKVANNPLLLELNDVPMLRTVGGALDLSGNFTSFSFPALNLVSGTTNVQSSGDIQSSCDSLRQAGNGDALRGSPECASNQETPGGVESTPTGNGNNDTGAATRGQVSAALMALSGAVMYALL